MFKIELGYYGIISHFGINDNCMSEVVSLETAIRGRVIIQLTLKEGASMRRVVALVVMLVIGIASTSFAATECIMDTQCGDGGKCIKKQGHFQGYCSNS